MIIKIHEFEWRKQNKALKKYSKPSKTFLTAHKKRSIICKKNCSSSFPKNKITFDVIWYEKKKLVQVFIPNMACHIVVDNMFQTKICWRLELFISPFFPSTFIFQCFFHILIVISSNSTTKTAHILNETDSEHTKTNAPYFSLLIIFQKKYKMIFSLVAFYQCQFELILETVLSLSMWL